MKIVSEYVDVPADGSPMRMWVAAPANENRYPGLLCYSDIFQLTPSTLRACARLAGYGFVVAVPEIYHRIEPAGTALAFDDAGRDRGLADAAKTAAAEFDADCRAALDYLASHARVETGKLGVVGWCIGGHLAFRGALQPDVRATVCYYATGVHNGKLGSDADAGSLARAGEIGGDLLMIWGGADPHVPPEGRETIRGALDAAGTRYAFSTYDEAEHAFMRDEGPRYDPQATDGAFAETIARFARVFGA
jgi:carboxymethylenebutenolidase